MLDQTSSTDDRAELLTLTADIISAYVGNNTVASADLPTVISDVFAKLSKLGETASEPEVNLTPAVPIKKSVTPASIACLECGKKFKMLKRHIKSDHDLEPADYRAKWGLNYDYPMVAPNYSELRKSLAMKTGLGRTRKAASAKRTKKT
jgi:predicted transcriptional regulator